jgi:hypothetical protein
MYCCFPYCYALQICDPNDEICGDEHEASKKKSVSGSLYSSAGCTRCSSDQLHFFRSHRTFLLTLALAVIL